MGSRPAIGVLVNFLLVLTALASAQSFEVVSVKPSDPAANGTHVGIAPGGIFQARGVTLKDLIQQAYEVRGFQISGGPGWIDSARYDIEAKGNGPAISEADLIRMTDAQRNRFQRDMHAKLRALMTDRFQLKVYRETREIPVYTLVVAKNGPKIVKKGDNVTQETSLSLRRNAEGNTELAATQASLASLVRQLSNQLGRPVIDKTALTGYFDFKMTFARDLSNADGPSLFTALQEQLGLKLESQRGPAEVVIIDAVERPSAN